MNGAKLERLRAELAGEVVLPGDADYDIRRRVFNQLFDRRPAAVVRCLGTADVRAALEFGVDQQLPIAIRSGGHNVAGYGTCDDGIVVDLSLMRSVRVDPGRRVATVAGGTTWGDFDREAQVFGLATTGGQIPTTGVAGLTLGGGWGTLARRHGLAVDNVRSMDLVTVDGRTVVANERENPELFWGLRGGGGNFGVVTSFEFDLHPVGPIVGGLMMFSFDRARKVLAGFAELLAAAPDELTADLIFLVAPDVTAVPEHMRRRVVAAVYVRYLGDADEADAALKSLRDLAPDVDFVEPTTYTALQRLWEVPGVRQRHYWTAGFLPELTDEVCDLTLAAAESLPDPECQVVVIPWSGQITRTPPDRMAFGHRTPGWLVHAMGNWVDPDRTPECVDWARDAIHRIRRAGSGTSFLNFYPDAEDARLGMFYDAERQQRLAALKHAFDPDNVLRLNQNVSPGQSTADML